MFLCCFRLAAEQNQCLPQVPSLAGESNKFGENEKMAVLENIRSMVPDHKIRVQSMEVRLFWKCTILLEVT